MASLLLYLTVFFGDQNAVFLTLLDATIFLNLFHEIIGKVCTGNVNAHCIIESMIPR